MPKVVRIHTHGGPEVMVLEEVPHEPLIDRTFSLEQIAEAHNYLEANQHMGKVIVKV